MPGNGGNTMQEIKELLAKKLQLIKNNPEYYGTGTPSKKKDYINYKSFLMGNLVDNDEKGLK